ncbi:MAG TPA: Crp/Fnr family transcriptional regulator [Alphaproteobacteria bacterium]|nr:Crp/Fnr family transcriptional regulator [Alphaproteobacteria bacterium]
MTQSGRREPAARSGEPPSDDRERLIRGSFIFRGLEPELIARLAGLSRIRRLAKGAILFQQGDEGDALYGVIVGLVRISVASAAGREITLGLMEPGDMFGEIALLDGLPRTAGAQAAEDSVILVIDRPHFFELIEAEPRLARHVIELLCERLRRSTDRFSEHTLLRLDARLARKLQSLAAGHGRAVRGGMRIALKLSQSELAQMLGASREAVNKLLQRWSRAGILRHERGAIVIAAPKRLDEIAASE